MSAVFSLAENELKLFCLNNTTSDLDLLESHPDVWRKEMCLQSTSIQRQILLAPIGYNQHPPALNSDGLTES